jgi:hypothetical protein
MIHVVKIDDLTFLYFFRKYATLTQKERIKNEYTDFNSFLKSITRASRVEFKNTSLGCKLYFDDKKSYTWFLLRWA